MKLLHLILFIAVLVQLSLAASVGRVKRDDNLVDAIKDFIDIQKRALPITEAVTKDILMKIPNTLAYNEYRADLEEYLQAVADYRSKSGPCVDKTIDIITSFDDLVESYEAKDATAEAKHIFELIDSESRLNDLEKELEDWGIKYNIADIDESVANVSFEDAMKLIPIVSEKC